MLLTKKDHWRRTALGDWRWKWVNWPKRSNFPSQIEMAWAHLCRSGWQVLSASPLPLSAYLGPTTTGLLCRAVAEGSLVMPRRLSSIAQLTVSPEWFTGELSGMLRPRSHAVPSAQGLVFGPFCRFLSKVVQLLGFYHSSSSLRKGKLSVHTSRHTAAHSVFSYALTLVVWLDVTLLHCVIIQNVNRRVRW